MTQITHRVYVDWNDDGDFADSGENITDYVMSLQWSFGLQRFAAVPGVGGASITLDNNDKRFSPLNTSSPYYDATNSRTNITPGKPVKITAQVSGGSETTMFSGRMAACNPVPGFKNPTAVMKCTDNAWFISRQRLGEFSLQENQDSDVIIKALLDEVRWGLWWLEITGKSELGQTTYLGGARFDYTNIQAGIEEFEWAGDNWFTENTPILQCLKDCCTSEGFPARFWFGRDGEPVFKNRQYMQTRTDTPTTIDADTDAVSMAFEWDDSVYNSIYMQFDPRTEAGDVGVIWTNAGRSVKVGGNSRTSVRATFVDAENNRIGARNIQRPEIGGDFNVTTEKDGEGDSVTANITVTVVEHPESAELQFQNDNNYEVYINDLRLRGVALEHFDPGSVRAWDGESINRYSRRDLSVKAPLMTDPDLAQGVAGLMLRLRKDPRGATAVTLANASAALAGHIVDRSIGDLIKLSESQTGVDEVTYMIVGEAHTISNNKSAHRCTWTLEPIDSFNAWLLGTTGRSELGQTTYLGL